MWAYRTLFSMSGMKYYKEIATYLNFKIPRLNQDIPLPPDTICTIQGLRMINEPPSFVLSKNDSTVLPFKDALQVAEGLKMDLCHLDFYQLEPTLAISAVKKEIYHLYYMANLKKKTKEKYQKTIQIGERIELSDLETKRQNVLRLKAQGHRRFRLISTADSDQAEENMQLFASSLGVTIELKSEFYKKNKLNQPLQRWTGVIVFDQEINVDVDYVNRKWRRKMQNEKFKQNYDIEDQELDLQEENQGLRNEILASMVEAGVPLPKKYAEEQRVIDSMLNDTQKLIKNTVLEAEENEKARFSGKRVIDEQEERREREKVQKFTRKFFGLRTVEEIVEDMDKLRDDNYQTEAYKVKIYQELEAELQALLKKNLPI